MALLVATSPAAAGPYEDALNAYDRADYATALRLYRVASDQGHPNAQVQLGLMYAFGRGTTRNYVEAVRFYRLAAEQGDAQAFTLLSTMFERGLGVEADLVRAGMWMTLAADRVPARIVERDELETKLTFAQRDKARELARACELSNFKDCF
jgi:TPR repeat protein